MHQAIAALHKDDDLNQSQVQELSHRLKRDLVPKDNMMLVQAFTLFLLYFLFIYFSSVLTWWCKINSSLGAQTRVQEMVWRQGWWVLKLAPGDQRQPCHHLLRAGTHTLRSERWWGWLSTVKQPKRAHLNNLRASFSPRLLLHWSQPRLSLWCCEGLLQLHSRGINLYWPCLLSGTFMLSYRLKVNK